MNEPHRDLWSELKASGKGDGLIEIPSLVTEVDSGYGKVRYSLGENGERRLLVPFSGSIPRGELGETGSLRVRFAKLMLAGRQHRFIDLICMDPTLDRVFEELVDEIIARISSGKEPFAAVRGTLEDFRALLFPRRTSEVSGEMILGLLGELHVLGLLAERDSSAVSCWVGPVEARHDFRTEAHAVEVKTTRSTAGSHVTIHGMDQLLPPSGGQLLLIRVVLEATPDGSVNLAGLYHSLLEAGVSRQALLERLGNAGCDDPLDSAWNAKSYTLASLHAWQVIEGFPRLGVGDPVGVALPAGVSGVQYVVDLASAEDYLLQEQQLIAWLDEMMA